MDDVSRPRRRPVYKIRSARVWALIRARYLAGETAPRLAEIFDVTEANLRKKAWKEGWCKRDLPDPSPSIDPVPTGPIPEDARSAARAAVDEAVRLMGCGQYERATQAARLAEMLGRASERLADAEPGDGVDDEATLDELRRKVLGLCEAGGSAERP